MNTTYRHMIRVAKTMMTALRLTPSEITAHSQRDYGSLPARLRLTISMFLMLVLGSGNVWGQETDYSGVYYIASDYQTPGTTTRNYNLEDLTNNFYLCPTENWISYSSTSPNWTTGDDKPFLTTYKARLHANDPAPDTYDLTQAKWTIEFYANVNGTDYYYFKHSSGQYMVLNNSISAVTGNTNKAMRLRVHLETLTSQQLEDEDTRNMALFSITQDSRSIVIKPKTQSSYQLTVNNGNSDYLRGYGTSKGYIQDGSIKYGTEGTIAIYNNASDDNKYFYLEDYITRPLITYNSNNLIEITDQTGSATAIYYTTDGTKPTTSSTLYTGAFDPAEGVTTIKAIAIVGVEATNVAVYTTPVLCGNNHSYLIQSQNNAWNSTDYHFYMIPGDDANSVKKVNTTSLFRPSMEWYFLSAGMENGVQFYYIVNNSVKDNENNPYYLCYDGTNNVHMETFSSDDKFKFKIVESATAGSFNIIPYAQRNESGQTNRFVYKPNDGNNICNANANALSLSNTSNAHSQWKFVQPSTLDKTPPFSVSDNDKSVYYKIANVGSSDYYIVPPSSGDWVTMSNSTDDANVEKSGAWYFEEAQAATDDDWLTYYYIRNAETGKYLYFAQNGVSNSACFKLNNTIPDEEEDRYMFTWARTATENTYYIIPKFLKDAKLNTISTLDRYNTTLRTVSVRTAGNAAWTFTPAELFCNDPVFKEEAGVIKIKCNTNAAKIYINTESDTDPTSGSTLYDPTQVPTQNWPTNAQVRIKAIAIVSDGTNTASSPVITLLNNPDVTLEGGPYEYKAEAWEPSVTSVSIGETVAPTSPATYTVAYSNNVNAGTASVTITDADNTDYLYIWNVPVKEFTIDKKPLTITANNKSIEYGDEPANEGVYYSEFAGTETEENLEGTLNYSYTTSGDDPHPYTPYDPQYGTMGEYMIVPGGLTSTNYSITFIPGTMTVSKKSVEKFTFEFDENGNIILKSGDHILTKDVDYSIGEEIIGEKYSTRNISGIGNYIGSITVRNAIVPFTTDDNQYEWYATFVAEKANETDKGHALPDGVMAFIISRIQGEWAIPEPLDYIPAGVPVLLFAREAKNGFLVKDANPEEVTVITPAQEGANMLEEVTEATPGYDAVTQSAPFATKQIYLLYKNEFVFNKAGNLKKGRVYLNPNHHPASSVSAPARLMISWTIPTDVQNLPDERTEIDKEEVWYTIDGRRLDRKPNAKGLYIVNGKKIVVK